MGAVEALSPIVLTGLVDIGAYASLPEPSVKPVAQEEYPIGNFSVEFLGFSFPGIIFLETDPDMGGEVPIVAPAGPVFRRVRYDGEAMQVVESPFFLSVQIQIPVIAHDEETVLALRDLKVLLEIGDEQFSARPNIYFVFEKRPEIRSAFIYNKWQVEESGEDVCLCFPGDDSSIFDTMTLSVVSEPWGDEEEQEFVIPEFA